MVLQVPAKAMYSWIKFWKEKTNKARKAYYANKNKSKGNALIFHLDIQLNITCHPAVLKLLRDSAMLTISNILTISNLLATNEV